MTMAPDRTLSDQELWDLTQRHFGDLGPSVVQQMYTIAKRESGGNPDARNVNPSTRDDSHGLWQINIRPDANPQYASRNLTNPEVNAQTARELYDAAGGASPWSTNPGSSGVGYSIDANGNLVQTADAPSSVAVGTLSWNGQGQAFRYDGTSWVREPNLDDQSKASTYMTPAEVATLRQSDAHFDAQMEQSNYQWNNLSAAEQANLHLNEQQFNNLSAYQQATLAGSAEDRAFAKEQWLFQQQNEIDNLQLERDKYNTQLVQNARDYSLNLQTLQFNQDKFAFESSLSLEQEARATQAQIFNQQAAVAGIQLDMAQIKSNVDVNNAQMQNAVAMFNAGKAADVSMFNIDQQSKVAMFNAQGAFNAQTFNAEMKFNVQKANVENERLRQQQLIDVASKISEAAKDPGDRGKLASLILALGAASGFGASDATLATADLRSPDSLMPLEAMLRQREDILKSNPDPFTFEPVTWVGAPTPQAATFTPAVAAQAPAPNFSGVQIPQVNTTPFDPNSIKTKGPNVSPMNTDSSTQQYIAGGQTSVPGEQLNTGGQALSPEQRAQIPDFAMQYMIDQGIIPTMAGGGLFDGTGLFGGGGGGDNQNNWNGWVAPGQHFNPMQAGQNVQQYAQDIQSGAQGPQQDVSQAAQGIRQGLQQYGSNALPGMRMGDNPQFQQWYQGLHQAPPANGQEFIARLGEMMGSDPRLAQIWAQVQQHLPNFQGGQSGGGASIPQGEIPGQGSNWSGGGNFPNWQPGQDWSALGPNMEQFLAQRWQGGYGGDTSTPHAGTFPQAAGGGMMQSPGFIAGDSPDGGMQNAEMVIPLGPGMALVIPNKQTKKMMASSKKAGAKPPKKMATGGTTATDPSALGASMYENLLGGDTSTTRAMNFLEEASRRAAIGTPFDINHLPTPVFFSSPGMPSQVTDIGAALNAIKRGIQPQYFQELVKQLRPAGYSEGVIGRSR